MRDALVRTALLTLALIVGLLGLAPSVQAGKAETYIVLYTSSAVPANAASVIDKAGGTIAVSYDAIGVVIASSEVPSFRSALLKDRRVEGVSATSGFAVRLSDEISFQEFSGPPPGDLPNSPVSDSDPYSSLQWDMIQIHVPEAHLITGGSPSVVVGDIDTGVDYTHPDLAANIDFANSVSCVTGVPNQDPAAWNDDNGHGTHTAGTIAAAANGIGIVGVAPNVKLAAIKAGNADGYFFPEAVICAFMWAGDHELDVTNNSYYADPWLFNCRNDPQQRAIWKAEQRAIRYAMSQGVVVVAAEGNENMDLSQRNIDTTSPDYPSGSEQVREVTNACVVIPVEIPGVIGVTANGGFLQKSYYSSYGVGVADVVAPGGDRRFQVTDPDTRGYVLSTYPGGYALAQGTSMASPHVAGVAALIRSWFGKLPPGQVAAMIQQTANPQACPPNPFEPSPDWTATCVGGQSYNGFYGHGQVNAEMALEHMPGR
jgi:subtilisin family serine protease